MIAKVAIFVVKFAYMYIMPIFALLVLIVMRVLEGVVFSDFFRVDDAAAVIAAWNTVLGAWWLLFGVIVLSDIARLVNWCLKSDSAGCAEMSLDSYIRAFHRICCVVFAVICTVVIVIKLFYPENCGVLTVVLYWIRDVTMFGCIYFVLIAVVECIESAKMAKKIDRRVLVVGIVIACFGAINVEAPSAFVVSAGKYRLHLDNFSLKCDAQTRTCGFHNEKVSACCTHLDAELILPWIGSTATPSWRSRTASSLATPTATTARCRGT